jgi:hypothetical protein
MQSLARYAIAAVITLAGTVAVAQEGAGAPTHNPFDRPAFMIGSRNNAPPAPVATPVRLELRATLVTAGKALANINGEILTVGDSYEGYRVVHVEEGRAIVVKSGERQVLDVYERQTRSEPSGNR